ncbi:MAG: hypothetical protein ABIJ86_00190 [Spirochaetota bacterium]
MRRFRAACLAGYIGFDAVREERSWTPDVVALMLEAADHTVVAL